VVFGLVEFGLVVVLPLPVVLSLPEVPLEFRLRRVERWLLLPLVSVFVSVLVLDELVELPDLFLLLRLWCLPVVVPLVLSLCDVPLWDVPLCEEVEFVLCEEFEPVL
jgi:hypothetical protein